MPTPWYLNPSWYALAVSLISVAFAMWAAFFVSRRATRASVEQGLIKYRNDNDAIVRHVVKGPFATALSVPKGQLAEFVPKVGVLFLHVNLLEYVYQHRDVLGDQKVSAYTRWAANIVNPWITSDSTLQDVMRRIYSTSDIMDEEFVQWLKQFIVVPPAA
jgi:hypothetical protein